MDDADTLIVRRLRADDAHAVITAAVASRASLGLWARPPEDFDAFRQWFAAQDGPRACPMIATLGDGTVVGCITISEIVRGSFESAYLGYWGHTPALGRGLMTRAVSHVLAEAFGPMGLHRLEVNIQPGNLRSIALARRVGFVREGYSARYLRVDGVWRDHERWAILSDMPRR
jgi:[ribosomal protein S5]-alanine N-acetyltransferase